MWRCCLKKYKAKSVPTLSLIHIFELLTQLIHACFFQRREGFNLHIAVKGKNRFTHHIHPVSYTHLDVYKRQLLIFGKTRTFYKIDDGRRMRAKFLAGAASGFNIFTATLRICLLYTSRCV